MIDEKSIGKIRNALTSSSRPIIFFDDDADGLSSFLQFYKLNNEAKGVIFKSAKPIGLNFLKKVEESQADSVFILDIHSADQDFLDKLNNAWWIDHHTPQKRKNVNYFNPMLDNEKDERPVSYWAYQITKKSTWLALAGCIGDWFLPEDLRTTLEFPELLPEEIKRPEDALFKTDIGKLARIFNFILKGRNKEAMACVKVLTRIKSPYEILEGTTSQGRYIWKKYKKMDETYKKLKGSISKGKDNLIVFVYPDDKTSLTSELSNELLYENPDKFIVIAREKNEEMKCSLRSSKYKVLPILKKSLKNIDGFGGGHLHACGCHIKKRDFEQFINNIREQL